MARLRTWNEIQAERKDPRSGVSVVIVKCKETGERYESPLRGVAFQGIISEE